MWNTHFLSFFGLTKKRIKKNRGSSIFFVVYAHFSLRVVNGAALLHHRYLVCLLVLGEHLGEALVRVPLARVHVLVPLVGLLPAMLLDLLDIAEYLLLGRRRWQVEVGQRPLGDLGRAWLHFLVEKSYNTIILPLIFKTSLTKKSSQ